MKRTLGICSWRGYSTINHANTILLYISTTEADIISRSVLEVETLIHDAWTRLGTTSMGQEATSVPKTTCTGGKAAAPSD
jgi:hypothetical protein